MANQYFLNVKIWNTSDIIFEGISDRVSSYNEIGPFDIYEMHANFISIIHKKVTVYLRHKVVREMEVGQAVLKVKRDTVHIFLGIEAYTLDD